MRGFVLALLPVLASSAPTFSTETIHEGAAPLLSASNAVEVPDSYIVVFKKHVTEASASDHHSMYFSTPSPRDLCMSLLCLQVLGGFIKAFHC